MQRHVWTVAIALSFITACGAPTLTPDVSAPSSSPIAGSEHSENWENPIEGIPANSFSAAAQDLEFTPRVPRGLGTSKTILVSAPNLDGTAKGRAIAFIFDSALYGRVIAIEGHDEISVADFEKDTATFMSHNGAPNVRGTVDAVTIKGAVHSRLTTGFDGVMTIRWREGSVVYVISGPTLTRGEILAIAEAA